jgi:PadR family transcriptional regulator AphA
MKHRTSLAVLGVLSYEPATGYDIRKFLEETTSVFWKESYGQIYPTLLSLESAGRIKLLESKGDKRDKKMYAITDAGRSELSRWIRSRDFTLKPGRNELLLKIFFSTKEDTHWLIPQVQDYEAQLVRQTGIYAGFRDSMQADGFPADRRALITATIVFGEQAVAMQLHWCHETLAILETID